MTREEKQKALDALKISAPVMAVTQEEFNDYIQTLNKIMNWLEQESTTRNCFGCKYSKDNHNADTEECHLCMWENQYTPQEPGHWIIMGDRYIKCSECGHITKTESPDIYHFCMVCGANMSEEPIGSESEG